MPPAKWLHILAWAYLSLCFLCAAIIIIDELRRPQKMEMMKLVWPITALYFGPAALWGYFRSGLKMTKQRRQQMERELQAELETEGGACPTAPGLLDHGAPTREQVRLPTPHCGAGCTLSDIGAEWWVFGMGWTFAGGEFQTRLVQDFLLVLDPGNSVPISDDCSAASIVFRGRPFPKRYELTRSRFVLFEVGTLWLDGNHTPSSLPGPAPTGDASAGKKRRRNKDTEIEQEIREAHSGRRCAA